MTGSTDAADSPERSPARTVRLPRRPRRRNGRQGVLRKVVIVVAISVVLYFVMVMFVARVYLIPSEAMEPTLHGCSGCTDDRLIVDKLTYRFSSPQPGDVIVFKAPPAWRYKEDRVKRVIAVGGQTVECRADSGLTVDGKQLTEPYLDPTTTIPCQGPEFGPVTVPQGRLWVMGDNRWHAADSRDHCASIPADAQKDLLCTGDPMSGTVPVANVIGKVRFIVWPPSRWRGVGSVNPQY